MSALGSAVMVNEIVKQIHQKVHIYRPLNSSVWTDLQFFAFFSNLKHS